MDKKAVIVLGMHRSGTSAVTAALEAMGVSLGNKSRLSGDDNEKGYFENDDVVPFNNRLLKFLNSRWDNPLFDGRSVIDAYGEEGLSSWYEEADDIFRRNFADAMMWGLKDPRLCQLLPFWRKVFEKNGFTAHNTFYIHMLRNPLEVALSQKKRHDNNPDFHFIGEDPLQTMALWLSSHFQALREVNSDNNIVISFDDFLDQPNLQLKRLADFLKIDPAEHSTDVFVSSFLEKELKHHHTDQNKLEELQNVSPLIVSLYNALKELAERGSFDREEIRTLLELMEPVSQAYGLFSPVYPLISTAWYNWQEEKKEREGLKEKKCNTPRNGYNRCANNPERKGVSRLKTSPGGISGGGYFRGVIKKIIQYRETRREMRIIQNSGLFDEKYYLDTNPDVKNKGMDPIKHFVKFGVHEGRRPNPHFDVKGYSENHGDDSNPFVHFILYGSEDGKYALSQPHTDELESLSDAILSLTLPVGDLTPDEREALPQHGRIAVRMHLDFLKSIDTALIYLKNIPFTFDLYVSIQGNNDKIPVEKRLTKEFKNSRVSVFNVEHHQDSVFSLSTEFDHSLIEYEYVCYVNTAQCLEDVHDDQRGNVCLDHILGSERTVAKIVDVLSNEGVATVLPDCYVCCKNTKLTDESETQKYAYVLERMASHFDIETPDMKDIECIPHCSCFWFKPSSIEPMLGNTLTAHEISEDETCVLFSSEILDKMPTYIPLKNGMKAYTTKLYFENQQDFPSQPDHVQSTRLIAYHLPQFYPFEENDRWWGKGFTEWTKVRAAKPLFPGHVQPRTPHTDIGYYTLSEPEALKKQVDLARRHGIYGFCFYHYWFSGKRIMEKPVDIFLEHTEIDIHFCLCWANESWTRKWDGNEDEILIAQEFRPEDDIEFIKDLAVYIRDPRYIRVSGKPLIMIYRADLLPNPRESTNTWRQWCRENGIGEIYLVTSLIRGVDNPTQYGFDAGVERPFYNWERENIPDRKSRYGVEEDHFGPVYTHEEIARYYSDQKPSQDFRCFRSPGVMWDPSPRHGDRCHIIHETSPELYERWLSKTILYSNLNIPQDERFVFINAWNEWAEGMYLEPDMVFGYAMLNATRKAVLSPWPWSVRRPQKKTGKKVLLLEHGASGGADDFLQRTLFKGIRSGDYVFSVVKNNADYSVYMRDTRGDVLEYAVFAKRDFQVFVELLECDEIHLNNITSWEKPLEFLRWLTDMVSQSECKLMVYLHDYFCICPSYHLINTRIVYCEIPPIEECRRCYQNNPYIPDSYKKEDIENWCAVWKELFEAASSITVFSESSKGILQKAYNSFEEKIVVKQHDMSYFKSRNIRIGQTEKLHIAAVGVINEAKGLHVVKNMADYIKQSKKDIAISLIGYPTGTLPSNVAVSGRYTLHNLPDIIEESRANVFMVPSVCPETFCYVASELMMLDVPLVCFDLGAQAERIQDYEKGFVLSTDVCYEPEKLLNEIVNIYTKIYGQESM